MPIGTPNSFTGGMVNDIDPRYQDKKTYREAQNARVLSSTGNTFTLENVEGNRRITTSVPPTSTVLKLTFTDPTGVDCNITGLNITIDGVIDGIGSPLVFNAHFATAGNQSATAADRYSFTDTQSLNRDIAIWIRTNNVAGNTNLSAASSGEYVLVWDTRNIASVLALADNTYGTLVTVITTYTAMSGVNEIIGYKEFPDFLILFTKAFDENIDAGQIWRLTFNADGDVLDVGNYTLLYNAYNLNFSREFKITTAGVLENNCYNRIYWTDFNNTIRQLNFEDEDAFAVEVDGLGVFPLFNGSQCCLKMVEGNGALQTGMYQYTYRLKTAGGAISPIAHFSALVHITSSSEAGDGWPAYQGENEGIDCGKSITMEIPDIDQRYDRVEIIAIHHAFYSAGSPAEIAVIEEGVVSGEVYEFTHRNFTDTLPITLEELLENKNTWDVCKDLAVKDNRLFAAHLCNSRIDLTFDPVAKSYYRTDDSYLTHTASDTNPDFTMFKYIDGNYGKPCLGGVSGGWSNTAVGGVRYSFGVKRYRMNQKNPIKTYSSGQNPQSKLPMSEVWSKPGITVDLVEHPANQVTDYEKSTDAFYHGPISPYFNDSLRGYQRGEIYRFGIVFYDKRGNPDFVRWISDIRIPEHAEGWEDHVGGTLTYSYTGSAAWTGGSKLTLASGDINGYTLAYDENSIKANGGKDVIWGQAIYPRFEVRLSAADRAQISGFSIVRLERKRSDKTILAQGVVHQVVPYGDHEDNDSMQNHLGLHPNPVWSMRQSSTFAGPYQLITDGSQGNMFGAYTFDSPEHHFRSGDLNLNEDLYIDVKAQLVPFLHQPLTSITGLDQAGDQTNFVGPDGGFFHMTYSIQRGANYDNQYYDKWITLVNTKEDYFRSSINGLIPSATCPNTYNTLYSASTTPETNVTTGESILDSVIEYTWSNQMGTVNYNDFTQLPDNTIDCDPSAIIYSDESGMGKTFHNRAKTGKNTLEGGMTIIDGDVKDNYWIYLGEWVGFQGVDGCPTILLKTPNPFWWQDTTAFNNPGMTFDTNRHGGIVHYDWYHNEVVSHRKLLANLRRKKWGDGGDSEVGVPLKPRGQLVAQYGGNSEFDRSVSRYIGTGHFQPVTTDDEFYRSLVAGGDINVVMYGYAKFTQTLEDWETNGADGDGDGVQKNTGENGYSCGINFPVETSINVELRQGVHMDSGDFVRATPEDFKYNKVYSQEGNVKGFMPKPFDFCDEQEIFPHTVAYSSVKMMGDYVDAWQNFDPANFHDVDTIYGKISNIFVIRNELYYLQEHATGRLAVNPRAIVQTADNTPINITTGAGNVIERHDYFNTSYGNQHQHSLVLSSNAAYWFDFNGRKLMKMGWTAEGDFGATVLSDVKGFRNYFLELFQTITPAEIGIRTSTQGDTTADSKTVHNNGLQYDVPLLSRGIHGIFDKEKQEILFTFLYEDNGIFEQVTICYNDAINSFTSFYTHYPTMYMRHNSNLYSLWPGNGSVFYRHHKGNICQFYDQAEDEFNVTFVVNDSPMDSKVFDNITIVSENEDNTAFTTVVYDTPSQAAQTVNGTDTHYRFREGRHIVPVRSLASTERLRDTYMTTQLTYNDTTNPHVKFRIFAVLASLRKSMK